MPADRDEQGREEIVRLHEEVLSTGKRQVERGRVRISIGVHEREQALEQSLERQDVEIERVPVGRPVDEVPEPRQEGELLIVPVVEEELVVTKRLVLKEEIHIRKRVTQRTERFTVTLRSEHADIARTDTPNAPSLSGDTNE